MLEVNSFRKELLCVFVNVFSDCPNSDRHTVILTCDLVVSPSQIISSLVSTKTSKEDPLLGLGFET